MATLTKKSRERKVCTKAKFARSRQTASAVVFREGAFDISAVEATELLEAMKQTLPLSPELCALVKESARRCVLK